VLILILVAAQFIYKKSKGPGGGAGAQQTSRAMPPMVDEEAAAAELQGKDLEAEALKGFEYDGSNDHAQLVDIMELNNVPSSESVPLLPAAPASGGAGGGAGDITAASGVLLGGGGAAAAAEAGAAAGAGAGAASASGAAGGGGGGAAGAGTDGAGEAAGLASTGASGVAIASFAAGAGGALGCGTGAGVAAGAGIAVAGAVIVGAGGGPKEEEIRWDIEALIRHLMPEELDNIDEMLNQFKGREADLKRTLEAMQEKSPAVQNPAPVPAPRSAVTLRSIPSMRTSASLARNSRSANPAPRVSEPPSILVPVEDEDLGKQLFTDDDPDDDPMEMSTGPKQRWMSGTDGDLPLWDAMDAQSVSGSIAVGNSASKQQGLAGVVTHGISFLNKTPDAGFGGRMYDSQRDSANRVDASSVSGSASISSKGSYDADESVCEVTSPLDDR
jgi:hypothetical protein